MNKNGRRGGLRTATVSTSADVQDALAQVLLDDPNTDDLAPLRITTPLGEMNGEGFARMDDARVGLVFVDLGPDRDAALKLTAALVQRDNKRPVVLLGPSMDTELVLAGMRAGASEYLTQPLDAVAIEHAISRLTGRDGAGGRTTPGQCVGVLGGKGGSGATTIATNLAVTLRSNCEQDVLLIDFDEFGTAGLLLGLWPRYSFNDVLENFHRLDHELFTSMIEVHESGVHLLSSPTEGDGVSALEGEHAVRIIRFAKRFYDFVVVDFGRGGAGVLAPALGELDEALLVVTPEFPAVRNMKRVISVLEPRFKGQPENVRLILNRETPKANITAAELATTLGHAVAWSIPREDVHWEQAADVGRPLVLSAGSVRSAKVIRAIGTRLAGSSAGRASTPQVGLRGKLGAFVRRARA